MHQQNVSNRQRLEDRQLAREQHEQDLNITRWQREQDREEERILREHDRTTARVQRESDLYSIEQQRHLDLDISRQNQIADSLIAEKERILIEQQRAHEMYKETMRRRDSLMTTYIQEMNVLIEQHNGTPTKNPWTAILMRVKSLTLIRQLDAERNSRVVYFLYAAGLLTDRQYPPPLDLSEAELDGIDLSDWIFKQPMRDLSLAGAFLRNASFVDRDFSGANFSDAILTGAHLNGSKFIGADFVRSNLFMVKAASANFTNANFSGANMIKTYLRSSVLTGIKFTSETLLDHANLYTVYARNVSFINMKHLSFTIFTACQCYNAHFDNSVLIGNDFSHAILDRATFTRATLDRVQLIAASTAEANFTQASMLMTDCTEMKSVNASFSFMTAAHTEFQKADLTSTNFAGAAIYKGDFSLAILKYAFLTHCMLAQTKWTKSDLFGANLSRSNLTAASDLTDDQFISAVSIHNAYLPNGTMGRKDPSLIKHGSAICNTTFVYQSDFITNGANIWRSLDGKHIIIRPLHNNSHDCVYALAPTGPRPISMHQVMPLNKYYPNLIAKKLVLVLSARFGNLTIVSLQISKGNGVAHYHSLSKNTLIRLLEYIEIAENLKWFLSMVFSSKHIGADDPWNSKNSP